jgi:hypothetical protein
MKFGTAPDMSCVICKKFVETMNEFHPVGGLHFRGHGHYGTTVFDPMDGTSLDICICDECLLEHKTNIYGNGRHHLDSDEDEKYRLLEKVELNKKRENDDI